MSARDKLAEVMKPAAAYDYWPQAAADRVIAAGWVPPADVARIKAEAKRESWAEGFKAGRAADHNSQWWPKNPYRSEP